MKIQIDRELKTLQGTPLKEGETVLTLRAVCCGALLLNATKTSGKEKARRYNLAKRIHLHEPGTEIALSADEIALIKKLANEYPQPLIVGQTWEMLDPVE